jgi:type II secretory pathway pseudopilin PulG
MDCPAVTSQFPIHARSARGESGFTLIELILTMSMLTIIVGAIAATVIVGLRDATGVDTRLSESHDAQRASEYFVNDAQSAAGVTLNTNDSCADLTPPLVTFTWADSGVANVATYEVKAGALHRRFCQGGALVLDQIVAHLISSATPPVPTCRPAPSCPGRPDVVQLSVQETSGYSFSLRGVVRSAPSGLGMLALRPTGTGLQVNSGATLVGPNAQIAVNSSDSAAATNPLDGLIQVAQLDVHGGCSTCVAQNSVPLPTTGSAVVADPFAALAAPTATPARTGGTYASGSTTLQPGFYSSGVTIKGTANVTFAPGTYSLPSLDISGGTVTGTETFIYVTTGSLSITGGAVDLSAPTGGAFHDVLIFQNRTNVQDLTIHASTQAVRLDGLVYAPNSSVAADLDGGVAGGGLSIYKLISGSVAVSNTVHVGP